MGQCNDAYGAIKVATALAGALGGWVNDFPLTLVISWFEQKAVAGAAHLAAPWREGNSSGPGPAVSSPRTF